jgi:O-antigen/teichoic acid export membrane protein
LNEKSSEYKNIFKSTFLFGFVQIFNILTKVLLNKAAAVFLGSEGIGLIGIFQSISEMIKTFFGLGVSQSAVRDVSKANKDGNKEEFSTIITVTHKIIWFTSLMGAIFTFVLSSYLSTWSFGDDSYSFAFMLLSIVIFFSILADGQLGILKGMRQLRSLAKATIFGSFAGLITGVPFYYFLGTDGIVPTLLVVAISLIVFSTYYVKKVEYDKVKLSLKETFSKSSSMIKMGVALMYVAFLGFASDYIIKIYIWNTSTIEMVGIYQVGITIVAGYFGIVITAMSTDYYPRISAVHDDNKKLQEEMNRQSEMGLLLIGPLIVLFLFLIEFFISFLYTREFLLAKDYILYALFGTIIIICSNSMGMILLAKQNSKVFSIYVTISRLLSVIFLLYTFKIYGMIGLGIATFIIALLNLYILKVIIDKLYSIKWNLSTLYLLIYTLVISLLSLYIQSIDDIYLKFSLGIILFTFSFYISLFFMNRLMNINIVNKIKNKFRKV